MAQNKNPPSRQKKKDEFTVPEIDPLMGWSDITEGAVKGLFGSLGGVKQFARGAKLFVGSFTGREKKRAESAAFRKSTQQSFRIGRDTYGRFKKSSEGIESQYVQNLASQKARFAGSGARLEGSWNQVVGQTMGQREAAFKELGQEKSNFYKSAAGTFIRKSYRNLGGVAGGRKKELSLGARVEDYSGSSLFTRSQYKSIQSGGDMNNQDYLSRVIPTFEEYQTLTFGSVEDKSALKTDITQRIGQANEWWAGRKASNNLNEMART